MTEEKKIVLSASKCKTYEQCPRKYYYSYIEKLPKQQWDHLLLGTFVHSVLEEFHRSFTECGIIENPRFLMKQCFNKAIKKSEVELSKEILSGGFLLCKSYLNKILNVGFLPKVINVEEKFDIALTEKYSVIGFVDRLDLDSDGVYHIIDYKTSKSDKYMDNFQLNVYGLYLLDKFKDVDFFRGSYIMLKLDSKNVSFDFNKNDVEKMKDKLISIAQRIEEEERWVVKPTRLCDYCDFKDVCRSSW
jgi:CRISPR/Cas system-associated exonuclease Cas4 (RecB family)